MANDIIDINVYETVETVAITVNPNLTTVNINKVTSSSGSGVTNLSTSQTQSNFTINSDTGDDALVPLGNGTLAGATLNNYTTTEKNKLADTYTKGEVDTKITGVYKVKGSVANYADLPSSGQVIGDVWNLLDTGGNYVWTGTVWDELGTTVDISGKANIASPTFTGTPLAPTATAGTNNTQIATTEFVTTANPWTKTGNDIKNNNIGGVVKVQGGTGLYYDNAFQTVQSNGTVGFSVKNGGDLTAKYISCDNISAGFAGVYSSGGLSVVSGGIRLPFVDKTSNYTLGSDYFINCNGTFNVTLPAATAINLGMPPGRFYKIKNSGTGVITILTTSSQTIDGALSYTLNPNSFIELTPNITQWLITSSDGSNLQDLQSVTDEGATTTNSITANSFIKSGGTSSQILAADGSVITAGTNITISGGTISSVGGAGAGGSSVNYYLNGGTSQGAFGGSTYYEFSKTAVIGIGADFNISSNGYIASFITDVADPSLLLIPGGNWNLEFYFSSSSAGGSPSFYVELYKYDGTTFTSIVSSSATPEGITNGTSIDAYFTSLAVPETILTVNDRLAIRVFVNASSKTITLHTQDSHLCEVITSFTSGLTALNGLQAQVQNFATGTTGTDFDIVSSGSTHTFNLPSAGATARGVVTTGSQTFAGSKTFSSNIVIPATGSPLILSVSSGGTVSGLLTTTYPDLTELALLKGVTGSSVQTQLNGKVSTNTAITGATNTKITYDSKGLVTAGTSLIASDIPNIAQSQVTSLTTDLGLKQDKSLAAYTVMANNTASTANASAQTFRSEPSKAYSGATPTWTGTTAPSGTTNHTYSWNRIGNIITLRVSLDYTTAGTSLTAVTLDLPSDCPSPELPSGVSTAADVINYGSGMLTTNRNVPVTPTVSYSAIRIKSTGVYEINIARTTAANHRYAYATIQYFTT